MNWGSMLNLVQTGTGFQIEIILLIMLSVGGLIFFAKSLQFGLIFEFIISGLCFMFAYHFHANYAPAAILFFVWLVAMALSLYISGKITNNAGLL